MLRRDFLTGSTAVAAATTAILAGTEQAEAGPSESGDKPRIIVEQVPQTEELASLRSIEVLEGIDSSTAQEVLRNLSKGVPHPGIIGNRVCSINGARVCLEEKVRESRNWDHNYYSWTQGRGTKSPESKYRASMVQSVPTEKPWHCQC